MHEGGVGDGREVLSETLELLLDLLRKQRYSCLFFWC